LSEDKTLTITHYLLISGVHQLVTDIRKGGAEKVEAVKNLITEANKGAEARVDHVKGMIEEALLPGLIMSRISPLMFRRDRNRN
jgi:hypothetical protein